MASLNEIRSKYLKFFEERGHAIIPSDSLVPKNDPTTLFTGSGMQPLIPYLLGKEHPAGKRVVDSQKCFRSMDIEEVGNSRHTTFFEMLGNWSLGDYFKKEQIPWMFEFLVDELGLDPNRLYITCFIGEPKYGLPKDSEAAELWQKLFEKKGITAKVADINSEEEGYKRGIKEGERIFYYEDKKNWWNRGKTGLNTTPVGDPCGPDSEMFYEFIDVEHDPKWGEHCHPNCDCGRFIEIGNNVFMAYRKVAEGQFVPLENPNIDHGSGLERIAGAVANSSDIFPVTHAAVIDQLARISGKSYESDKRSFRIIADHMKAAVFLIADGVLPSNTDQGYFVRRLIRRSVRYADQLGMTEASLSRVVVAIADMYKDQYPEVAEQAADIETAVAEEESRFRVTLARGLKEFERLTKSFKEISGADAFMLFSTYGFPLEMTEELAAERGITVDTESFKKEMAQHQDLSRAGSEQKFKGGLADASEATTRLHTAHHLLLKALQMVLGPHVKQRGSNITGERLRIDFSHGEKMTDEQKKEVERIVNEKIQEHLPMIRSVLPKEEAEKLGAEHEFGAKYPDMVSVYSLGPVGATEDNPQHDKAFSIEFCGGPHVANTEEIAQAGTFKIKKEEASSAGIRRIKAVIS
jgi:alanyl-tRNA synthetase